MTPAPEYFFDIHTHRLTGERVLTSISPDEASTILSCDAWYSVGIHPWDTIEAPTDDTWQRLEDLATNSRVAAIGECGLDALRGGTAQIQEDIFRRHVEIAERVEKFMIIHCVRRFGRIIELRRELQPRQRWIVHGFRGKPELARQLIAAGFDISLGVNAPQALRDALPLHHFFVETDEQ